MSTKDISRFLFQPKKRYSSVRMQQGRVILDSDWNESERIDDEEARRTLIDVICSKGTSNQGFRVGTILDAEVEFPGANPSASYDFDFENGSFYIGGLRFETDDNTETFLGQNDWLQIDASADNLPARPQDLSAGGVRQDLVYLRGWEQCVTAVEDSELREQALGTDTSVRIRRMRRVEVLTDVPDTCSAAFNALRQQLTTDAGATHEFDQRNCELKSKARITVVPNPADITEDPCKPAVPGGYLGADNQTIRVQLTATDRFIWGYDNAAPLYRVQVENILDVPEGVDGTRRKIRFLTLPRDQVAQLWSDRDEPQHQQYFYLRLWTGGSGDADNPDHPFTTGTPVTLEGTGLSTTFSDHGLPGDFWVIAARPNTPKLVVPWELLDEAPPFGPRYFFAPLALIRWTVDADNGVQASVQDCRERFRSLCDIRSCCTVTVGDGVSSQGDFDSIEGALSHLPPGGGEVCVLPGLHQANVTIEGKRNIRITGCDKQTRLIPREAKRQDPILHVIDSQCITLEHMDLATLGGTAVVLQGSAIGPLREIKISHNRILASQQAIQVERGVDINICQNRIRMLDKEGGGVAVFALAENSLIEGNDIGVVPPEHVPPPDVPGEDIPDPTDPCEDPEHIYINVPFFVAYINQVFGVLLPVFPVAPFKALGGIQIAAASERIKVLENTINGGSGNGITLGGILASPPENGEGQEPENVIKNTGNTLQGWVSEAGTGTGVRGIKFVFTRSGGDMRTVVSGSDGFFITDAEPSEYAVSVTTPDRRIESITSEDIREFGRFHRIAVVEVERQPEDLLAFIYEIQIDGNEIMNMGLSGIGIPRMSVPKRVVGSTKAIVRRNDALAGFVALLGNPVVVLGIHRNHIYDCLRNPFDAELRAQARRRGFGGISLGVSENVTISGNRIERNGITHVNPVCGIFIAFGEKIDIHHNLISDNGPMAPDVGLDLERGQRGGIIMIVGSFGIDDLILRPDRDLDTGLHACRIHDNIVHQPAGQALRLFAIGPVSVCHNRFNTELSGPEDIERLVGTLLVLNLGGGKGLPSGITLFNGNQSRLGSESDSITSQIIWTVDDLGFDANQSIALADGIALTDTISFFINTLLFGATLRASDSRFKETPGSQETSFRISLLSLTKFMNNTSVVS